MIRLITKLFRNAALALAVALSAASCNVQLTDTGAFALYYPGITDIGPSTSMDLTPSWHGGTPSDFEIYRVVLEGQNVTPECFLVDASTGVFQIRNSASLAVGKYTIGIACNVNGSRHEFPEAISVNMMKPVPDGITVTPDNISVALSQVTSSSSSEELPTAQISTDGDHISIKNYLISSVRRDGTVMENWDEFFSVDKTGKFTILRNGSFKSGIYVFDFKLTTMVVGTESEEGIFTDALTVDVTSPPVALVYTPAEIKVEQNASYTTSAPAFTGSLTDLNFSIKSTYPETDKVSIDSKTGAITLTEDNGFDIGSEITVSVTAVNSYGTADFDQVLKLRIVEYISPITMLSYNDTTVWEGTKVQLEPLQKDGDEVSYTFENLPESLSALSIDELTGVISVKKGNTIPLGEYSLKVKAENAKGSMTADLKWTVIENPYAFTYVSWGNNLSLTPATDYASQHRVSVTDPQEIPVVSTDIKDGVEVTFEISGGSNTNCVTIDQTTGKLTTVPETFTKVADRRAHFVFVKVTTGKGTSGETVVKTPVFFDFNTPRTDGGYSIEYTPFAIKCNPKNGVTSASPTIKLNGEVLSGDGLKNITMDFRRSFNYWNLNGPSAHKNGAPDAGQTTFLAKVWATYYAAINVAYNSGSRDPISSYGRPQHIAKAIGYVRTQDLALYIAPEKFLDDNGYANGIFTGQITFSATGVDPVGAADPYRLFPLFVWFDTQF